MKILIVTLCVASSLSASQQDREQHMAALERQLAEATASVTSLLSTSSFATGRIGVRGEALTGNRPSTPANLEPGLFPAFITWGIFLNE